MSARTVGIAAAGWFLLDVAQLLAALAGPLGAVLGAAGIGLLSLGVWRLFHVEFETRWAPVVLVGAGTVQLFRRGAGRRCGLCNRGLRGVALACPRCGLVVCDSGCWVHEHCRCRLCEDNRVSIFPPEGRWWDQRA